MLMAVVCLAGCASQRGYQVAIPNFDRVDGQVYRGAQPNALGIERLKAEGIRTVISLRGGDAWSAEEALCRAAGMAYTNVGMRGVWPSQGDLVAAMAAMATAERPVFVHCQWGCERTGLVIGCYRIDQGWSVAAAWNDAKVHGSSSLAGMKSALKGYARRMGK